MVRVHLCLLLSSRAALLRGYRARSHNVGDFTGEEPFLTLERLNSQQARPDMIVSIAGQRTHGTKGCDLFDYFGSNLFRYVIKVEDHLWKPCPVVTLPLSDFFQVSLGVFAVTGTLSMVVMS